MSTPDTPPPGGASNGGVEDTPPRLVVLCGLPFAGKSTLARALAPTLGAVHLELDAVNSERGLGRDGVPISRAQWVATYREGRRRLEDHLAAGRTVVYDAVTFRWAHREQLRRVARRHGADGVVVWVATPVAEIGRRRRANRERPTRRDVRPEDFALVARGFEPPRPEEAALVYDGTVPPDRWARDLAARWGLPVAVAIHPDPGVRSSSA